MKLTYIGFDIYVPIIVTWVVSPVKSILGTSSIPSTAVRISSYTQRSYGISYGIETFTLTITELSLIQPAAEHVAAIAVGRHEATNSVGRIDLNILVEDRMYMTTDMSGCDKI